jgi:long-chain acyl-CoA synthetase
MFKHQGRYVTITYAELLAKVSMIAAHLKRIGIAKGDAIGIISCNRPEWVMIDLAALQVGAVVVPIYPSSSPSTVKYVILDSKMKLLVMEDAAILAMISDMQCQLPDLEKLILIDASGVDVPSEVMTFDKMCEPTSDATTQEVRVLPEDTATIVYTSGTTGEPKGVVLTHANIRSNVQAMITRYQITCNDIFLSYLPLCHMFERTCGYYAMLFSGATIAYAENLSTVTKDVLAVRPTILLAVPRVVEKAFEHAVQKIAQDSRMKQWIVAQTISHLNKRADLRYRGQRIPFGLRLRCSALDKTIAAKFRKIGGGRLRIIASGGAPLDRKVAKAYYVLGYNLVEGYGLTETSPVVCSNGISDNTLGTVGKPVQGVEVQIGDDDEVLVKGPNVMRGYFNKPEETAQAIDKDGWFHTGDQGRFDARGNLIITGRIKDLIVTSYGKNVAATAIEARIARSPYVSQVMLYGDRRKYLVALVVPMRKAVEQYAADVGIAFETYESLLKDERIHSRIAAEIEEATTDCAPYEKVKAFRMIPEEFTQESGLLTPLLKLRRKQVAERYWNTIESLYETSEGKL